MNVIILVVFFFVLLSFNPEHFLIIFCMLENYPRFWHDSITYFSNYRLISLWSELVLIELVEFNS